MGDNTKVKSELSGDEISERMVAALRRAHMMPVKQQTEMKLNKPRSNKKVVKPRR